MALRATVFRAELGVSDLDRHYYAEHSLTLARHPSETDERMMVRLLAFALYAGERLEFGRGLSAEDEADLWERDYTGAVARWIDVGLPDERDIRRACSRAAAVNVVAYGRTAPLWWERTGADVQRFAHLSVLHIPAEQSNALATHAARSMQLRCTIQEGSIWFSSAQGDMEIQPQVWLAAG